MSRITLTNRFRQFVGLEQKAGLAAPDAWLTELFGANPPAAGISISPRSAMTCAPVRAAVTAISEPIGTLPLIVYQRGADGSKQRATDHPIHPLLHDQANDWTSASAFRETLTRDALLYPNGGIAYIARNSERKPISLFRLNPDGVSVTVDAFEGPTYKITEGGQSRAIPAADIFHIPSPALTGGLVSEARDAIGLTMLLERHASKLFANNARPSGVLSIKGTASADALQKIKTAWIAAHGGDKSGGTAVIPSDAEWRALTMTSVDAQFLELRAFQINEIARVFRVPPILLYEYGRATWGNSESMRQDFLDFSLMRWITAWENEVALKLLTADERKTYFAEFLVDGFVRSDLVKRTMAYTAAVGGPWLLANEARAAENRPPVDSGDKLLPPPNASGVSVSDGAGA